MTRLPLTAMLMPKTDTTKDTANDNDKATPNDTTPAIINDSDGTTMPDKDNDKDTNTVKTHGCPLCPAMDSDNMILCKTCNKWIHYQCTELPAYFLSQLVHSRRKFECSICVAPDPAILDICKVPSPLCTTTETATQAFMLHTTVTVSSQTDTQADKSTHSHDTCWQLIRDLEQNLVQQLLATERECHGLKIASFQDKIKQLQESNSQLQKENIALRKSDSKKDITAQLHQLRMDMERQFKDRATKWTTELEHISNCLQASEIRAKRNDELLINKEQLLSTLQDKLTDMDAKLAAAKDETYEAKRTQVICPPPTDFIPAHSPRRSPRPYAQVIAPSQIFPPPPFELLQPPTEFCPPPPPPPPAESFPPVTHNPTVNSAPPSAPQASATLPNGPMSVPAPAPQPDALFQDTGASQDSNVSDHAAPHRSSKVSDSQEFQSPRPRRSSRRQPQTPKKPCVLVIGNSHFDRVTARRLVPSADVVFRSAYTLEGASKVLDSLDFTPDCVVLHQITNDVKFYTPRECVNYLNDFVAKFVTEHPSCKVIISMGIPRSDDIELAANTELVNVLIKQSVLTADSSNVTFCDHSNFSTNGYVKDHLLHTDGYHLSSEGQRLMCSNVRYKIELTLGLSTRRRRPSSYSPRR